MKYMSTAESVGVAPWERDVRQETGEPSGPCAHQKD